MGNTKSVDSNGNSSPPEPVLEDKLSQAVSDTALNKKTPSVAELKKKKYAESNRSMSSIDAKNKQPAMSSSQRQILKYCINNAKDDLGERILRRVVDKNPVFQDYFEGLPKAERAELTDDLKQFIVKVVEAAVDSDGLENVCRDFGGRYARHDFKPDFVQIANSMTTECVFLDLATHPTTETLQAWSQLTSNVFSMVRDGYYSELRRLRRVSNISNSTTCSAKDTEEVKDEGVNEEEAASRSADPSQNEDANQINRVKEPVQFLAPPPSY